MKKLSGTERIAVCGLLGALALALSALEGMLPPLPGIPPGAKPGFSNLAVLAAAETVGLPGAVFLALLKAAFSFAVRGVVPGCMSLAGGVCSAPVLWLILKKTRFSPLLAGVCGALAHNAAQLTVALVLTGAAAWYYAPAMLLLSVLSGLLTGAVYLGVRRVLRRRP